MNTILHRVVWALAVPGLCIGKAAEAAPPVNQTPSVSLSAPADGAIFLTGATISLTAVAGDPDGSVARVDFYKDGSVLIGSATTAPYTIGWNSVAAGSHSLTAKATDNKGASATSSVVSISVVSSDPPVVALTGPTPGSAVRAGSDITLSAAASDPDGAVVKVDFYNGETPLASDGSAPYEFVWPNVAGGRYPLTARATDDQGVVTISPVVNIVVVEPPLVAVTAPVSCSVVDGPTGIIVAAEAESPDGAIAKVDFLNDGSLIGTATVPPYAVAWGNVPVGVYSITAVATDNHGFITTSRAAGLTVRQLNMPPSVSVTAPASGTVLGRDMPVTLAAAASDADGTVVKVDFYAGSTRVGTSQQAPFSTTWTPTAPGYYWLTAVATDNLGATTGSDAISVNVKSLSVALTAPLDGAVMPPPATFTLGAVASDTQGVITKVGFYAGTTLIGTDTSAPYSVSWADVPVGQYALTARVTNNLNVTVTSSPVTVAVSTLAVTLTAPTSGASFVAPADINLVADATVDEAAIAKVDFYDGATLLGSDTTAPYSYSWTGAPVGTHTLTARATDSLGVSVNSAPVTASVNPNTPPAVSLAASGGTFYAPASITLAATAADGDGGIAKVEFYKGATLLATVDTAPFAYTWTGVAAGSYSLTAKATDIQGGVSTSAAVGITVLPAPIAVTSLEDGATVTESSLLVSGTIAAPVNSGLTVNGILAILDNAGHFYANGVPLQPGANALTLVLTTPDGLQYTRILTVNYAPVASAATITAGPLQGLAPLVTTFTVTPANGAAVQKVDLDYNDDGTIDGTITYTPTTTSFALNFDQPATYRLKLIVTDSQGAVTDKVFVLRVIDKAQLDGMLKDIWNGLGTSLAAGDKTTALNRLSSEAQAKYGPVFDALQADLPTIVAAFSPPELVSLTGGIGEYAVTRSDNGITRLYLLYFTFGPDGVWRIDGM